MSPGYAISISMYLLLNIVVTVTNKRVVSEISTPYLLTALHALTTLLATSVLSRVTGSANNMKEQVSPATSSHVSRLGLRAHLILVLFSLLYTVNIAISNVSLSLVSLPLHQTIRATAPIITVLLAALVRQKRLSSYPRSVYLSLTATVCGVCIATWPLHAHTALGQWMHTAEHSGLDSASASATATAAAFGVTMTFAGAVLAVVKTMVTNRLQRPTNGRLGLGLAANTLIQLLAPYAVAQALAFAVWTGEVRRLADHHHIQHRTTAPGEEGGRNALIYLALVNTLAAPFLNIASFEANRRCGPLSMAVASNLKQVVILVLGALWPGVIGRGDGADGRAARNGAPDGNDSTAGWHMAVGTLLTVAGGIWYGVAEAEMKKTAAVSPMKSKLGPWAGDTDRKI